MNEQSTTPLRVILADDHAIFRHGVRAVVEHFCRVDVVAECGNGTSALDAYLALRPDVMVLDLRMPGLDGLEVTRRVLEADRAARILVMTSYATDEDIGHALRAGARGYLLKDATPEEMCRAIKRVADGGMAIAPDIAEHFVRITMRAELSPRESQILCLMSAGKPNKEIARDLCVELSTVKGHVKSVLAKLRVRNRTEAVAEGMRRGTVLDC